MTTYTVKDTAGLLNTLKTVKDGDTVYLKAGNYGQVNLNNVQVNGNATIMSLDPSQQAVFTGLQVKNGKGLTFQNLEMAASPTGIQAPFQILNSSNVVLDKLYVHGSLNGTAADDVRGMLIRGSSNVTVSNSRFEQLADGLNHVDNTGVTFTGNRFENLRDNGIAGGGSSNLKINDNYFTNFDHTGDTHPDAIQVWTSNTKTSASNITISGNVFDRGSGSVVQGIWMRDEVGNLPYQNVTISDNTIVGAAFNGIGVNGVNGLKMRGNTVLARDDQASWISITNATGATVSENVASKISYTNAEATKVANMLLGTAERSVAGSLSSWLAGKIGVTGLADALETQILTKVGVLGYIDDPAEAARPVSGATTQFSTTVMNGTAGVDRLTAGAIGDHRLEGNAGNDVLIGSGRGATIMNGGAGDDIYVVKGVKDVAVEGENAGTDTIQTYVNYTLGNNIENVQLMTSGLSVRGNGLNNVIAGTGGDDSMHGEGGNDNLQGGAGQDVLYGGIGNDTLKGDAGDDQLFGEDGNDLLYGAAGNDILDGGAGVNQFDAGAGADKLYGGNGQDTFVYRTADFQAGAASSMDDIFGFSSAQRDKIHLGAVDAKSGSTVDDGFKFIGTSAFHSVAGELRYEVSGGDSYVMGDMNGDGVADLKIHIVGVTSLTSADFVL